MHPRGGFPRPLLSGERSRALRESGWKTPPCERTWSRGAAAFLSASPLRRSIFRRIWPPGDPCPLPRSASASPRPRGLPSGPNPGKSKRLRQAAPRNAAAVCSLTCEQRTRFISALFQVLQMAGVQGHYRRSRPCSQRRRPSPLRASGESRGTLAGRHSPGACGWSRRAQGRSLPARALATGPRSAPVAKPDGTAGFKPAEGTARF